MNAIISLCHFCELHGPSVLLSTQAFHDNESLPGCDNFAQSNKSFYGNAKSLACKSREITCDACQSMGSSRTGFISNDHEGRISYLSTQQAMQSDVAALVHQACIRSLSCEVSPGKEGPVFFGDEVRGHVLSRTFFLKDAQARGFHRWFSVTILMRDKLYLLNSWPFFVEHIGKLVAELQAKAVKVHEREQIERPQRSLRLAAAASSEKTPNKPSRSPAELTGDSLVFPRLHLWFSWLLRAGAERLTERMPEPLPTQMAVYCNQQQETEEGFTLVYAGSSSTLSQTESDLKTANKSPCIKNVRHLRELLDLETFLSLIYGLMIGRQIVVRGQPLSLVKSMLKCLEDLLPLTCCKVVYSSDEYVDVDRCNLLGMETRVAVPRLSATVLRLDVLPPEGVDFPTDTKEYTYKLNWSGELPAKLPTLLYKMEKAIDNPNLSESVMQYHFIALKEEWLNIAKLIGRLEATDLTAMNGLERSLGVQEQDKLLIQFWAKATRAS